MKRFTVKTDLGTKEIRANDLLDAALQVLSDHGIEIRLHPSEVFMQNAKKQLTPKQ